jgi:predicted nucleotidyltransferase
MKKSLRRPKISEQETRAIEELKKRMIARGDVEELILYGSAARNEKEAESDLDVLVITSHPYTRFRRHEITDTVFEVNLQYDTNISTLVVDRKSWDSGLFSVLPLHAEIAKEGMRL